ncbi:MAG: CoB--CoM heterodisulfide reductase iron-sulfur subunit B family protein [Planctomycetota bacterium]
MKYAYFPGCSLESTAWDFDRSVRAVCRALELEIEEIPDWVCCGSTPAHATSATLALALPVVSLQKAQSMGASVVTACASCYARLRTANHKVRNDASERARVRRITEAPYDGDVEVRHFVDVLLNDVGTGEIRHRVKRPLSGLKVACYYGCLLTRPPEVVAFDDPENPRSMEELLEAAGAKPVDWPYRTECCGAGLSVTDAPVVGRLSHRLLGMARQAGAECLAVACPLCQVNLDLRQADAKRAHGDLPDTPALYVTQLLGVALGLSAREVGLKALTVGVQSLLAAHRIDTASLAEGTS